MNRMRALGFRRGVDLGGWFSQCDYSRDRLDHFIEKKDFGVIASWGLDHVRIPVDYNVLEMEDGRPDEEGFARIEKALGWCREYGLKAVFDLHKTAGFSFDDGENETGFFRSAAYQERFYRLWEEIAKRFGQDSENLAFELLNEVTEESYIDAWNRISTECIRRIRKTAPDILILVGSYHNNSAEALKDLAAPADENVIYNFHCYEPVSFTHQGAYWVSWLDPEIRMSFEEADIPEDFFDRCFAPALEAARKYDTGLYCGEYGVIDLVSPEDTLKWYRKIHEAFEKYDIPRCAWSYREMDFGLSGARLDGVREELLKLL